MVADSLATRRPPDRGHQATQAPHPAKHVGRCEKILDAPIAIARFLVFLDVPAAFLLIRFQRIDRRRQKAASSGGTEIATFFAGLLNSPAGVVQPDRLSDRDTAHSLRQPPEAPRNSIGGIFPAKQTASLFP